MYILSGSNQRDVGRGWSVHFGRLVVETKRYYFMSTNPSLNGLDYLKGKTSLTIIHGIGSTPTFCTNAKTTKRARGAHEAM